MSDNVDQLYDLFNPSEDQEKYWCNECNCIWFEKNKFEDLCPHCESEHIFSTTITEKDVKKYHKNMEKIEKLQKKVADIREETMLLSSVKRKG